MKSNKTKYVVAAAIGVVTIAGALAYLQFKKIMDYVIGFKRIKIKNISLNKVDFDVFLTLQNKSDITYTISEQEYSVYANDVFITKLVNYAPNKIQAKSTSELGINVSFNPKDVWNKLGMSAINLLSEKEGSKKIMIKIVMRLKVKVFFIPISIPYTYEDTLKNMTGM